MPARDGFGTYTMGISGVLVGRVSFGDGDVLMNYVVLALVVRYVVGDREM